MSRLWILLPILTACGSDLALNSDRELSALDRDDDVVLSLLATPPEDTATLPLRLAEFPLSSDPLVLRLPITAEFQGQVTGGLVTPGYRAEIPTTSGPFDSVVRASSLESPGPEGVSVRTESDGSFDSDSRPGATEISVIPDSPRGPMSSFIIDLADGDDLDLDLTGPVPVYGRVTLDGGPLQSGHVRFETPTGALGPWLSTDAEGWYEGWVAPGSTLLLVSAGRLNGTDPVLRTATTEITAPTRRDFAYRSVGLPTVSARALSQQGGALAGLPYRLQSLTLDDYPEGTVVLTGFTDTNGNLASRVPAGEYELTLVPDPSTDRSVVRVSLSVDEVDEDLGTLILTDLVELSGTLVGPNGVPLQSAVVSCTELDGGQRTWSVSTALDGSYRLFVGDSMLSCGYAPSGIEGALASIRVRGTPETLQRNVALPAGAQLDVIVRADEEPVANALVEILDQDGLSWGATLTDEDGEATVWVAPRGS